MEGDYGVLVANKFVLLDEDDGDPLEALQKSEVKAKKEEKSKGSSDKAASDKNKNVKKVTAAVPEKKPEKTPGPTAKREVERPPRLQNRPFSQNSQRPDGERRRFPPKDGNVRDDLPASAVEPSNRGTYRGRARGRGFGRERAGPGDFDRFGKREFERHSGSDKTGIKPVVKREGGGSHNWGQPIDPQWELQKENEPQHNDLDESADAGQANTTTNDAATEEAGGDNQTAETPVEEQVNEMTLDEWKAANEKNRTKTQFNIRKPNEGQEDPKWKKMYILKKEDDEEDDEEEEESETEEDHQNKKNLVNIEITFGDSTRRGFGRRGAARGGRGRGRGGDRYASAGSTRDAPHVDDQAEFPALGGKA